MNSKVKIRLYHGSMKILKIVDSTDNDGMYHWSVPFTLQEGTYYIRVKTIDNQIFDDSETFEILEPKIRIISPRSKEVWCKGNSYGIKWDKKGEMNSNVKIRLYQGSTKVFSITNQTQNEGLYAWRVPKSLKSGSYKIRVKTIDNLVYDDSNVFNIKDYSSSNQPSITISSPKGGEIWKAGEEYTIQWSKTGDMDSFVGIWLCRDRMEVDEIIHRTENDGSFTWRVPDNLISGFYYIKIKTLEKKKIEGKSEVFHIVGSSKRPELEVMGIKLNGLPENDMVNTFDVTIKNNGDDFSGYVDYRVVGMDKFLSGGKYTFDRRGRTRLKLARGETCTKTLFRNFSWPPDVCKVTYSITLDPLKRIYDLNRRNNTFSKTFYKGEILFAHYCDIQLIPKIIKIGKANLRPVPDGGAIVLSDNKFNIFFTLRNNCSKDRTWDFYIVYDFNPYKARGENKVIWHSKIRLKSCEVRPLIINGLKIPVKKEFKVLVMRVLKLYSGEQRGYDNFYQIKVKVDK